MSKSVKVFVSGDLSGVISRSDVAPDTFLYTYDAGCAAQSAVSLTMPVVSDQYDSMGTIHPIFEMNLPEGRLRQKLELLFSKVIRNFDALSLLEVTGKSQIGRLRYAAEGQTLENVPTQSVQQLLAYKGAEDLLNDLMDRFASYSGISGMQPKVLIRDAPRDLDRITDKGATHIVKGFDPREYPELAANEYFSMRAAAYAGLTTANTQLSENRQMLVVERFDRTESGHYLGFEDFCVLSGMRSNGRYQSSYEALAKKISVYVSPENHADAMKQFFGTVALACTIRNGDAHLKNFGILYDAPGVNVRLAPVYDMLSTRPYHPHDVLALELNGSKEFPSGQQLRQFGRHACGLTNKQVETMLDHVNNGVLGALQDLRRYAETHQDFQTTATYLTKVFSEGAASLGMKLQG